MPIRISITGVLGGGKSAVCGELEKLNLKYYSTGVIQRKIAVNMGMTTLELNEYSETHPEIDELIDSELRRLSESPDDVVIDSRMAWHFVKDTFKVFLWADETVAARRVMSHHRGPSEQYTDTKRAMCDLKARKCSENIRFKDKYGVDCGNFLNFDLVIDTTDMLPECIAGIIMDRYARRNLGNKRPELLISPRCLYPTALIAKNKFSFFYQNKKNIRTDTPVKVIYSGGYFFIYDKPNGRFSGNSGHHKISCLCRSDMPSFIVCELAAQDTDIVDGGLTADEFIQEVFHMQKARDWEDLNGFNYESYPVGCRLLPNGLHSFLRGNYPVNNNV